MNANANTDLSASRAALRDKIHSIARSLDAGTTYPGIDEDIRELRNMNLLSDMDIAEISGALRGFIAGYELAEFEFEGGVAISEWTRPLTELIGLCTMWLAR